MADLSGIIDVFPSKRKAELYGVTTGNLNLAVRRNRRRFPEDFMFQLTADENEALLLQIARAKGRGGRRTLPCAFTEHGVAMLSSVPRSERAILVNVAIMRTFGQLREILATHKDLARKLEQMERKYDTRFRVVFDELRKLMSPGGKTKRTIGFRAQQK